MIRPLRDLVLLEMKPTPGTSEGGIVVPSMVNAWSIEGTVLAVGPDVAPYGIEPGQAVLVHKMATGTEIPEDATLVPRLVGVKYPAQKLYRADEIEGVIAR